MLQKIAIVFCFVGFGATAIAQEKQNSKSANKAKPKVEMAKFNPPTIIKTKKNVPPPPPPKKIKTPPPPPPPPPPKEIKVTKG